MGSKKVNLAPNDFVHLHNHSQYSLLDGLTKLPELVARVKELRMESVAITDHGTLSGAIEFYKEATALGIKPIIGMETYVAPRRLQDRDPAKDKAYYHLILLAMNDTGYKNLMRLSTIANLEGFYYRPRIDRIALEKYHEGLIVLSGCIGGELGDQLRQGQYGQAKQTAEWYKAVFGDRYYLEVQDHGHPDHPTSWKEQVEVTEQTLKLAKELDIPCVVTADAHYLNHEDQEAHEVLLCVQTGSFLSDTNRMSLKQFELHVTDPKEIFKRWGKSNPELIRNTSEVAKRCNLEFDLGNILIPKFPLPKQENEKSYLRKLVYRGLAWRYGEASLDEAAEISEQVAKKTLPNHIIDRAEYELKVIDDMGFNGYFLIISDFINWGKDRGIVFGPGRGSAAGSIVSYGLKITELDPLKYDLLFERFLNPDRISMPDIDIDIQDSRRDEVIQYCIDKYGEDRVANIVTFGRMAARNAVRDVARVLQVPYAEADRLAKMIPPPVQGRHVPLSKSLQGNADLKKEYQNNKTAKQVFDLAMQLEGTIRSHGVHAAGVVIAPDDIVAFVPLEKAQKGVIATQYAMGPIEDLGLLKMDFLGLSNLTIIKNALRIIKKVYNQDVDISQLPLDDKKAFELLGSGNTTGVFQFESSGMKRYLKELKPTEFDDIIAMGALYRPGPLSAGLTDSFIKRKNGQEPVTYGHKLMKNALESTYGVLVYQEQFMQISRDVCGFSGGEADTLRKAIGKKKRDIMKKMEKRFIEGAVANGIDKAYIEKFWDQLLGFADYCFNKSHAACYGMISYWTAYLKAHYPAAFMAALMTSDFDNTDRLAIELDECKKLGLKVLPPDVNESFVEFAVVPKTNQIRFGMAAIKNVGRGAVEEILRAREGGHFANLEDFLARVNTRVVNRKALESLIKAGTMDGFGDRGVLLNNLDAITAFASRVKRDQDSGQTGLFSDDASSAQLSVKLQLNTQGIELGPRDKLIWERELLGLYLSEHPLDQYAVILNESTVAIAKISTEHEGAIVQVGGNITDVREITTKNGKKMAFVRLSDKEQDIEMVVFPKIYEANAEALKRDNIIIASGKVATQDRNGNSTGDIKILADKIREITLDDAKNFTPSGKQAPLTITTEAKQQTSSGGKFTHAGNNGSYVPRRLFIRLFSSDDQDMLIRLKETIDANQGDREVVLVLGDENNKQIVRLPSKVSAEDMVVTELKELVGSDNIRLS